MINIGIVVKISAYYDWEATYFVQTLDETEAKEKAYKIFKQSMSCSLPDTLEQAENNNSINIEIVTTIDHVLI